MRNCVRSALFCGSKHDKRPQVNHDSGRKAADLAEQVRVTRWLKALKVSSMIAVSRCRRETGELWQGRFFDHALRTVKDYWETVEYNHLNPVRRGLVKHSEQWRWSSYSEYAGLDGVEQERQCGLKIDRVRLPADQRARI